MIGDRIKQLREERSLSQYGLSEALGMSRSAVSLWESNDRLPSVEQLRNLCETLRVSADFILELPNRTPGLKPEEETLLRFYRELNDKGKQMVLDNTTAYVVSGIYQKKP